MLRLDHIAVGAANLESGIAQISDLLGAKPVGGGKHPLFGTHNALWRLEGIFPTYLEVIAIDPDAPEPSRARWFGLDDKDVQARLAEGPKLLAFVANCPDIELARQQMPSDPGAPVAVSRGSLTWQFTLPEDGALIDGGALPYLIEWPDGLSPVRQMSQQGIELVAVSGRRIESLQSKSLQMEWPCVACFNNVDLFVSLTTPSRSLVTLRSP